MEFVFNRIPIPIQIILKLTQIAVQMNRNQAQIPIQTNHLQILSIIPI